MHSLIATRQISQMADAATSGPGRNRPFDSRGWRSGLRRLEKRRAEREERAAAGEHAQQMQEAHPGVQAQTPHDALVIFSSDFGTDIAYFIGFLFIFWCLVPAQGYQQQLQSFFVK